MKDRNLAAALERTCLQLVSVPSPIGEERALCDLIQTRLEARSAVLNVERYHDSLLVRGPRKAGAPKIALVGHLDTVRTQHEGVPRVEDGRLYGAGSADMKSGLAVMLELVERTDLAGLGIELTLVFYEREEGPYSENRLGPMLDVYPELRGLDLAICLEPSDNKLQLGCMGSVHGTVIVEGRTAHSARPWQGDNAIVKAAPILQDLGAREPRDVMIDGLLYREVLTPTLASGGRGRNIVPDRFEINVNARFAPGRTPDHALAEIQAIVAGRARVEAFDRSPAGRPHAKHPLVTALAESGVVAVEPKQAWTDVARFDALGVAAVNFGPGTQAQAHQRNEWTAVAQLIDGYEILETFLRKIAK